MFEGAFEKIFSIIKEEGDSEGGVVVQVNIVSSIAVFIYIFILVFDKCNLLIHLNIIFLLLTVS